MKKSQLLIFLLFFSINAVKAQFAENNAIYYSDGLNIGSYFGVDFNLNYIYKEKYSVKVGYIYNRRKPKNQPEDYSSGLANVLLLGTTNPHDRMENYQLALGKIYSLNQNRSIRLNLSFGLAYTVIREPENWQKAASGFLVENYTWNYQTQHTLSLIINPRIEFPFTRIYGFSISPMVQINKDRTCFGIGIGQMIGLLRKRNY